MTDIAASQFQGSALVTANDGSVLLPGTPAEARARLAALQADPAVLDVLLNPTHPQHRARLDEQRGLQIIAASSKPEEAARAEADRQRQVASAEAAERAGLAERMTIFRDMGRRS